MFDLSGKGKHTNVGGYEAMLTTASLEHIQR